MKKTLLCLSACLLWGLLPYTLTAQNTSELDRSVDRVQRDAGMRHALLAVCVYDLESGKAVYSHNADLSVVPASLNKLYTTGVGFAELGEDFRFTTGLYIRGEIDRNGVLHGNVYINGGGDPMLGSYRYRQTTSDSLFSEWTRALKKKGIKRVDGRVCYNTTIFDEQPLHDTWQYGDIGNYYSAGVSGLNFHENMYFVYFNAGKRVGYPATVSRMVPKSMDVYAVNEVTTGNEKSGDNVTVYGQPLSKERIYRGTVPLGKQDFPIRAAMPDPAKSCADLFSTYLRTHGIAVSANSMQVYAAPDSLQSVLDYRSAMYYTIAQYTNLTSNNIYAESIFKYLGYKRYGKGSYINGAKAVQEWFKGKGLSAEEVNIVDGSGLSRLNRTTADFLCRYLVLMSREDFFESFLHTIAKAGESGTAKNLLPNLPSGTEVYVKTGTMDGVKAYAGYVLTANGHQLAFTVVSNGHNVTAAQAAERLSHVLRSVASLY